MDEFLSDDDDLVCAGMTDDWDSSFLEQLSKQEDDDDDSSAPSPPPPSPKLKSFKEPINVLEEVSFFLEYRGVL